MSKKEKNTAVPRLRFSEFKKSEGWTEKTLGEICHMQAGKFVAASEISTIPSPELFPCFGGNGLRGYTKSFTHDGAYSLIGRQGALCGNVQFVRGKFHATEHAVVTTPEGDISKDWLYFALGYLNLNQYATGQAQPGLSVERLESLNLYVPSESTEQQKIANCLSSLDELITAQGEKIEALKNYKKGLLQQLFPQDGETVPRLRFPEFKKSGDWEVSTLDKIGEIITGNTPSTSDPRNYVGEKMFVSPADISESRYIGITKTTLSELGFSKTRQIPKGSVMFVCIGSTIGKIAQCPFTCATNQQINSIIPFKDHDAGFVYYALKGISEKIAELAGRQAVPIINKTQFSATKIKFPVLNEQIKIASSLSYLDELIDYNSQNLIALKQHKTGLLQQLFPSLQEENYE